MANTNFLPEDYVEKKTQRRTNVISLSLFIVVMASIIGAFLVTDRQRIDIAKKRQQVNAQFEEAANNLEKLEQLQEKKQEMLRKAKVTSMLIERIPRSLILAELINNMPGTLSLLELDLETKVVRQKKRKHTTTALDKAKKNAKKKNDKDSDQQVRKVKSTLKLVGVAPTDIQVAQYMTSLSRSKMFQDVNLSYSEEIKLAGDNLMRKFRVDMTINQDVDIREIDPKHAGRSLKQDPMSNTIQIDAGGKLVIPDEPVMIPGQRGSSDRDVLPAADNPSRPSLKE